MIDNHPKAFSYEFGPYHIDTFKRLLFCEGKQVQLSPKAFDTLLILIENRGRVIGKQELMDKVWPDSFVEEVNLTVNIWTLRKALGENPNDHRYIVTIPRRGYSFVAKVKELKEETSLEITGSVIDSADYNDKEISNELASSFSDRFRAIRHAQLMMFAGALVLIISIVALWTFTKARRLSPPKKINSIAVLPFKLLNNSDNQYMEVAMADALIRKLGEIDHITVRPTISILSFADKPVDPVTAGRKLGVDAVLNGTIQEYEDRVRISLQLIEVTDGRSVWADRFDEKSSHPFALQDSISEQVARALDIEIGTRQKDKNQKRYTENTEAHQLYLRGMQQWNKRNSGASLKSISYFQQAIEKDALYAPAYAGMADSYCSQAIYFCPDPFERSSMLEKARGIAKRALDIDSNVPQAYATLAIIQLEQDRDIVEAERLLKRAIEIDPNLSLSRQRYSIILAKLGRLEEALLESQKAVESDPLAELMNANMAHILYLSGQYDQAAQWCHKALDINEHSGLATAVLGLCYLQKGLHDEAVETLYDFYNLADSQNPHAAEFLGYAYAVANRRAEALRMIDKLKAISKYNSTALCGMAIIYEGLGESDKALSIFEEAYANKVFRLYILRFDPRLEKLRSNPRFEKIATGIDTQMI